MFTTGVAPSFLFLDLITVTEKEGVHGTLLGGPHLAVHRVRALSHRSC